MITPTIHLNGTSPQSLYDEYYTAKENINKAIKSMEMVTVHSRDYYIAPTNCYKGAVQQHLDEVNQLVSVSEYCERMMEYLSQYIKD